MTPIEAPDHSPYPMIVDFLDDLDKRPGPDRRLVFYGDIFSRNDFYNISEIATMTVDELVTLDAQITKGNAKYLIESAAAEVSKVDKARKRATRNRA